MTTAEKITMAQTLIGDTAATDALVSVYLDDANSAILRRRYQMLQVKLAVRYFLRRGGEGEMRHSENGIDRTYGSVNDEDLLMEVTPFAKVI